MYSFAAAGTSKKEQSYVEGWARQERDGTYKLFARLQNKKLKMEPRFRPSVGSGSSDWRKEKKRQ